MTRAYALLASLLLIAPPLAGCTSSPELEEIVDDILGCMDENAENYAENATAELLGDCIYLASMEIFITAMTEQMKIDEMLEIIPRAGYSMTITSSEWNTDMNMQMDTVIEEMVMADLDTDSVYVKMGMSVVPFMTYEYTQVQVGELVNVHYTMGGMMAAENAGMGSYQTRDATPDVMGTISALVSVTDPGEANEMLDLPTSDVSDLSSEMPADAEPVITFNDESGVQTMTIEYTNDTGHDITIVTLIDENEDLMSYEISTDNGSATSSVAYTAMWGDAVVIEVDDTLPRTSIPINFHVEGMPEDNWDDGGDDTFYCDNGNEISRDLVDDGWDDCGDGSDESDDDGEGDDIPTPEEAMEDVDTDGDGYMSHQEFQDAWGSDPSNPELDSEEVAALFDDCDYDGNDLIDIDEVQCCIDGIGDMFDPGEATPEQIFDWMNAVDDGQVTASEWADFANTSGDIIEGDDFDNLISLMDMYDYDNSDGLDIYEFAELWDEIMSDDDDGDGSDDEEGEDEPFRVTMMVMGQTLNAPISDFEVRFLVDCGEPDEEGNEPPISDCSIAASNGLTEGSATVDPAIAEYEFTYEYLDYDGDGLISDMDTLVIDNLMPDVQVELYDTWADQYTSDSFATAEMLPGFGALMAVVVLLGAAFATRRD